MARFSLASFTLPYSSTVSDTLMLYHTCTKHRKNHFIPIDMSKNAIRMANSVDPDQTPRSVASDLGLQC